MKKRFTDCDIWDDPWFRGLPCLYKEFWRFICDKADPAGVWKVDLEGAGFHLKEQVSEKSALELYNAGKERVKVLTPEYWWLTGFVKFQYGGLSRECKAHNPVFETLSRFNLSLPDPKKERVSKGYPYPIHRVQDKDKDKDIGNRGVGEGGFDAFWEAYPKKVGKGAATKAWKGKKPDLHICLEALKWQTRQDQWTREQGKYIPHPATWINQERWQDAPQVDARRPPAAPRPSFDDLWVEHSQKFHERVIKDSKCVFCNSALSGAAVCSCEGYRSALAQEKERVKTMVGGMI